MIKRKTVAAIAVTAASFLAIPVSAGAATTHHARPVVRAASATTSAKSLRNIPVTGTASNHKAFKGHMTVTQFVTRHGKTYALGTLTGKIGKRSIKPTQVALPTSVQHAAAGSATAAAVCSILHLTLGPLHLNLLGLHVDLNRVILNITAVSGPGQLLGNLLCGVANLLNGSPLSGLTGALTGAQVTGLLNIVQQLTGTGALLGL